MRNKEKLPQVSAGSVLRGHPTPTTYSLSKKLLISSRNFQFFFSLNFSFMFLTTGIPFDHILQNPEI
jgi:hypothetical protein